MQQDVREFDFGAPRRVRAWSLTPMVDVVFLLLVFFMLAAQFGADRALPLGGAGGSASGYQGAPRLVGVSTAGISLNGAPVAPGALVPALAGLMPEPGAMVILRPEAGVPLERSVQVIDLLRAGGIANIVLAEPPR